MRGWIQPMLASSAIALLACGGTEDGAGDGTGAQGAVGSGAGGVGGDAGAATSAGGSSVAPGGAGAGGRAIVQGGAGGDVSGRGAAAGDGGSAGRGGSGGVGVGGAPAAGGAGGERPLDPTCDSTRGGTDCVPGDSCRWTDGTCTEGYCDCIERAWVCYERTACACPPALETDCGSPCDNDSQSCLCRTGGGPNYTRCTCTAGSWACG